MTKTLRKQLAVLSIGGTVMLGIAFQVRQLQAQEEDPQSAAEAAQLFGRLLAANDPSVKPEDNNPDRYLSYRLISRSNQDKLAAGSFTPLLRELQMATTRPAFDVTRQTTTGDTTTVEIAPAPQNRALPVVVVKENDQFRIDLLATYAKRMNVSESGLPDTIYNQTHGEVVLEGLSFINAPSVQNSVCQTRLRQIGLAIAQYTQDYDELYPRARDWQQNLYPYLQYEKFFSCPAVKQNGYALNANLAQQSPSWLQANIKNKVEGLKDSSHTISVYETSNLNPSVTGVGTDLVFRHQQSHDEPMGANFLYADGHVSFRFQGSKTDFSWNPRSPKTKN